MNGPGTLHAADNGAVREPMGRYNHDGPRTGERLAPCFQFPRKVIIKDDVHRRAVADEEDGHFCIHTPNYNAKEYRGDNL